MKKEKKESPTKAARKKTRDAVEIRITRLLKTITVELGLDTVDTEKEAKKLAKRITKGLYKHSKTKDTEKMSSENGKTEEKSVAKLPPALNSAEAMAEAAKSAPHKKVKKTG
jgi:hypothetical protein